MRKNTKILLILSFLLVWNFLSAQTNTPVSNDSIKFKFDQQFISISPLYSPRICLGILKSKKMSDDRFFESILYIHAFDTFSIFRVYGVAYRGNAFISENRRSGFYFLVNGGVDYIQYDTGYFCFSSENCDSEIRGIGFINAAVGIGYSFKLKNESYIRLESDIGIKWFVSNIYISYVW
ncbi:MAG: hypothetical protein KAS53_00340 [Candidatus Cloacimonetes bacterium]|nr:hypothetical protein [Candidatus Cloacimonadota bacterium]